MDREKFQFGDWFVDPSANSMVKDGHEVVLEPLVMDVLVCLVGHAGEVVSRDTLVKEVWGGRAISDEAVSRTIFLLRSAFRDCGEEGDIITTVRKRGYRLESAAAHSRSPGEWWFSAMPGRLLGLAATLFLAAALWAFWPQHQGLNMADLDASGTPIVILPFKNTSGDPDKDYLATALTEAIFARLGRNPRLMLISPTAFQRDPAILLAGVSDVMGRVSADYAVEGSLGLAEGRVVVFVRLIDRRGRILWSDSVKVNHTGGDISAAQSTIARQIAGAVGEELATTEICPMSDDAEALELYYRGRHLMSRRGEENLRRSISLLRTSLERDPFFSHARSSLGMAYYFLPGHIEDFARSRQEKAVYEPLAKEAIRQALDQCTTLGEAYLLAEQWRKDDSESNGWIMMEQAYRKAIELEPSNAHLTRLYADHLEKLGRTEDAFRVAQRAYRLNPLEARALFMIAFQHIDRGELDKALEVDAKAQDLGVNSPPFVPIKVAMIQKDWATARELAAQPSNGPITPLLLGVLKGLEDDTEIPAAIAGMREAYEERPAELQNFVIHFATLLGDLDFAYGVIENAPDGSLVYLQQLWRPQLLAFRQDSRFNDLAQDQGWFEYWREFGPPDSCSLDGETLSCR